MHVHPVVDHVRDPQLRAVDRLVLPFPAVPHVLPRNPRLPVEVVVLQPGQRERLDSPRPEGPAARTAAVPQAATQAPQDGLDLAAAAADEEAADLQAVVAIYHKWIGLLGEAQYERLRYWLETMGMGADVIAAAIRQAAIQAPRPRMSYVEGILRNWYNDGIRTLEDLVEQGQLADLADAGGKGRTGRGASPVPEGAANAAAYRPVDPEQVARWKELYPDEY